MNYFKSNGARANSQWSPIAPRNTSRSHAPQPETGRPRAPQNHIPQPQPDASFNLEQLVIRKVEFDFNASHGNPEGTPVYRTIEIYRDSYKLQHIETGVVLREWYEKQGLRLASGQEAGVENRGDEGSSKGDNEWDAKTLVDGNEGVNFRDDETLRGDNGA